MIKKLVLLPILFLFGCSLLAIDYSDYPVEVGPGKLAVYDLSNGASKTSEIYFQSSIVKGTFGDTRHIIVQTELDGVPVPKPNSKGRLVEGLQASKIAAGVHSLKFQWMASAPGGFKFNVPYSLVKFNFAEGKRYLVKGSGQSYWIEDMDTGKTVEATILRHD